MIFDYQTIQSIHDAFDEKKFSVLELAQTYFKRAQKDSLGVFLTLASHELMSRAQELDQILAKEGRVPRESMPLFGVPLGVKDLIQLKGMRLTCGSKLMEHYVSPFDATVVERLRNAGGLFLGKLNLDEFGMGNTNEFSAYGPVHHPTHQGRVPGGSSGGSAVAVKAGYCIGSLGTDTGGSVRLPSHFCGVMGLKPTYGRLSRYGMVAYGSSLDQIGPLAGCIEDVARLFDVMSGYDERDPTSAQLAPTQSYSKLNKVTLSSLKVGFVKEHFSGAKGLSDSVKMATKESLKWFEKKGASIQEISLKHLPYSIAAYYIIATSEASSNLARFDGVNFGARPPLPKDVDLLKFYEEVRKQFGPEVKKRIMLGTFALSSGYSEAYYGYASRVRRLIQKDLMSAFDKVDLLVGPVGPNVAHLFSDQLDPLELYLMDIYTVPANLAGIPAVSVPCGKSQKEGLPIGIQFMGKFWSEELLLSAAHAFSKEHQI